jgi:hypothetical protein
VCVDHGRAHIFVTQQLLHRADVIASLEQMGGEAMAQGMTAPSLDDFGGAYSPFHGILQRLLVEVVAAFFAGSWIDRSFPRGEDVLPPPLAAGACVFPFKRKGQVNVSETLR